MSMKVYTRTHTNTHRVRTTQVVTVEPGVLGDPLVPGSVSHHRQSTKKIHWNFEFRFISIFQILQKKSLLTQPERP